MQVTLDPAEAKTTLDPDDRPFARQVMAAEAAYWRRFRTEALRGTAIFGGGTLLVWLYSLLSQASMASGKTPGIAFSIKLSAGAGIAAAGTLATVVIGLQVAVRAGGARDRTLPEALARSRALSSVASFCGTAAIALGLVLAFQAGRFNVADIWHTWAPVAGGALLAFIAADAASAIDSSLDEQITRLQKETDLRQWSVVRRLVTQHGAERRYIYIAQTLVGTVVAVVPGSVLSLVTIGSVRMVSLSAVMSFFMIVFGVYFGAGGWILFLRRQRVFAAFAFTLNGCLVLWGLLEVFLAALRSGPEDGRTLAVAIAVSVIVVAMPVIVVATLCSRRGIRGRNTVGLLFIAWICQRATARVQNNGRHWNKSRLSGAALVAIAVVVPPVGLWIAIRQLRRPSKLSRSAVRAATWISTSLIGLTLGGICVLYVWHPPLD